MRRDWFFWRFHFIWRRGFEQYKYFSDRGVIWWKTSTSKTFDFMLPAGMFTITFGPKVSRKTKRHRLEHSSQAVTNTHPPDQCLGEYCTIHNMSDHSMRSFPQNWRSDRGFMERICPHGVGHPDPDEVYLVGKWDWQHGCDGCCEGAYKGEQE